LRLPEPTRPAGCIGGAGPRIESVCAARQLSAPWALCPSTTDPDTVREWLTWTSVEMEGLLFKRLDSVY
jgi:hypothetical protein